MIKAASNQIRFGLNSRNLPDNKEYQSGFAAYNLSCEVVPGALDKSTHEGAEKNEPFVVPANPSKYPARNFFSPTTLRGLVEVFEEEVELFDAGVTCFSFTVIFNLYLNFVLVLLKILLVLCYAMYAMLFDMLFFYATSYSMLMLF
jgi:hypothetical protein